MNIPLTRGRTAIVDSEDYLKVKDFFWSYSGITGYACAYSRLEDGRITPPIGNSRIAKLRRPKVGKKFLKETPFYSANSKKKMTLMHRLITNFPKGMEVDHINGNKLDNRRSNLRVCTRSENAKNRRLSKSNKSGYHGVHYATTEKRRKRWAASIRVNGKKKYIGRFFTLAEAVMAYNKSALKYHGKFATLN